MFIIYKLLFSLDDCVLFASFELFIYSSLISVINYPLNVVNVYTHNAVWCERTERAPTRM
jgi:hypothetical protein